MSITSALPSDSCTAVASSAAPWPAHRGHRSAPSERLVTARQDPQLQLDALDAAGCYAVNVDVASGKTADRPELTRVLEDLRPRDTLVVWRLDRLGRSVVDLLGSSPTRPSVASGSPP